MSRVSKNGTHEVIVNLGGAPHQLALVKEGGKRYLYTVCFDSGKLLKIGIGAGTFTVVVGGLSHPVVLVLDEAKKYTYLTE